MEIDRIGVHESTSIDFPFDALADELSDLGADVVPVGDDVPELSACDLVITFRHRPELLEASPSWVHTTQAGVDEYPLERYADAGIALTNSTGLHGDRVGETTVGLMLCLARRLHEFIRNGVDREWSFPEWDAAFTLTGESVCVVGLGTVGSAVATKADALGMDVVGVRRSGEAVESVRRVYSPAEIHDSVADVRFVVLAVPLIEETESLVDEAFLDALTGETYLVNVARGGVVDEEALLSGLEDGRLAGAALDVFETEPLPPESPFWEREDVIVTPHAAVADRAFYLDIARLVRGNVRRARAGESLENRLV